MSSFFVSSDKIQVGQTDVSVPSENGLNYKSGGKIDLYIPPTSKFVDLSQSRLKMNVSFALPTVTATSGLMRTQLDAQTGLHSLIRSIRIFSGRKTALLEEIEGYDILTALRFDYETNDNLKKKRALTEGATDYDPACRGTLGTTKTIQGNCFSNQYFSTITGSSPTLNTSFNSADDNELKTVKAELHLNTGLFRNEAVFPALLTDGIFIEILLQEKKKVFRKLDTVARDRHLHLNPMFHSINGSDNGSATNGSLENGDTTTTLYVTRDNNNTSTNVFPFVVGQKFSLTDADNTITNGSVGTITAIEQDTNASVGVSKIKITTTEITSTMGFTLGGSNASRAFMVDRTPDSATSYDIDYTVSNVELIVKQIQVPDGYEQSMMNMMKEGGTINYDYRSFTNYRFSQLSGDNVANIRLPLIESRATSILCIPTDASNYSGKELLSGSTTYIEYTNDEDVEVRSARSGLVGISDNLQEYQFIYDGKINPSRKVDVSKISAKNSISQQWCIESEKALAMADIEPLSFRQFQSNFFIGRALALGKNAVYDARGKDFNLQVEYTGTAQTKSKLWNNFVSHLRRLEIKNGGLSVMV
mgnify:FL=1|tara:strand:- start:2612 stop:4378 length:1767 start_codon:yes stop_codon:yes gene_type:complete